MAGTSSSFTLNRRISAAKAKEITTIENFVEGYRSREDTSLLKPETLVAGSHDVLVGNTGRVRSREGYYFDGNATDASLQTGLVSYYNLNANSKDSVGSNNGSDTAISYATAGIIGNCATFDGTTSTIDLGNNSSLAPANAISISFWVKSTTTGNSMLISKGTFDSYYVFCNGTVVQGNIFTNLGSISIASSFHIIDGNWHHFVMTWNNTDGYIRQYIDGALDSTSATTLKGTLVSDTSHVFLGNSGIGAYYYTGSLDELAIFSRALSASEISRIYNYGHGTSYPMLVPFNTVISITRPLPDWEMGTGFVHHLRAGGLTSAGNDGQLQLRWTDTLGALGATGSTYWLPLLTALTSTYFQSTNYWDTTALKAKDLFVNRSAYIWEWTGAIGTIKSVTSGTIVLNGSLTLAQLKFDASGYVINNGVVYQYDSISGQTFTLHSGTPDPTGSVVNSPVYQQPVSYTFSGATFTGTIASLPTGFTCDLIGVLATNQVMVASITNNMVFISQKGTYKDYSQAAARLIGDGAMCPANGNITAFSPQENDMYISAGQDEWYTTKFVQTTITNSTTGTTVTYETAQLAQLKTASQQASQGQYCTTKIINDVVYLSNEPFINSLGRVDNILLTPQITNLSYPIVTDMNSYNFTDASLFYFKLKLYIAIPDSGVVLIYNMTNPKAPFWEAPHYMAISGFCAVGNTLIGHSYSTFESYVMYTGYSDRAANANATGNPINSVALFAMQGLGLRAKRKSMNKFFVEGYITQSTTITVGLIYRSPGNGVSVGQTLSINGTASYVLNSVSGDALGKTALGKNPLATDLPVPQQQGLSPYFAVVLTASRDPFLAYQPQFSSTGTNQRWEILAYGNNASPTYEMEQDITN